MNGVIVNLNVRKDYFQAMRWLLSQNRTVNCFLKTSFDVVKNLRVIA